MCSDRKRNIFVFGLDDWHLEQLNTVRGADGYRFHPLLAYSEIVNPPTYPIRRLLEKARAQLDACDGPVDAIIGHWDFPSTTLLPFLNREYGLRGASVESVFRCEHKYLCRQHQYRVEPAAVPDFQAFDPFADDPWAELRLDPPFWMKPIKAYSSYLGFRVHEERDFRRDIEAIRRGIGLLAEPFNHLLELADMEDEVGDIDGYHCLAEKIISGHQCTLEGYVQDGEPHIYGVIDSFRGPNHSTLERYEFPSVLPLRVQRRMIDIAGRVMLDIGYDNAPFNIEFFHNRSRDELHILEINPRISKSHCPLFELVTGASHHEVAIEVALGMTPSVGSQNGPYERAAKFMVRRYEDARVVKAPDADRIAAIERSIDGVRIQTHVEPGMWLSELPPQDQDSYSYETAVVFVGADSRRELFTKYREAMELLDMRYATDEGSPPAAVSGARATPG